VGLWCQDWIDLCEDEYLEGGEGSSLLISELEIWPPGGEKHVPAEDLKSLTFPSGEI
jgi:hypothetical protein